MTRPKLRVGISPCPNDTFAFHGLLTGAVRAEGCDVVLEMHDVQALNSKLARGELDASKVSYFAALQLTRETIVLRSGSALGFGVGPLLLARRGAPELGASRVLCPGAMTTAHFLYRTFHPGQGHVEQVVFSDVIPRLERGEADYGVCIHEGRFTYARHGLTLVEDLGATWEHATQSPLPLGGIVARRSVAPASIDALDAAIRASLDCARADPNAAFATMRAHARELEPSVIWAHVDLYVNEWTRDLGPTGSTALRVFEERARAAGLMAHDAPALCVRDSG